MIFTNVSALFANMCDVDAFFRKFECKILKQFTASLGAALLFMSSNLGKIIISKGIISYLSHGLWIACIYKCHA